MYLNVVKVVVVVVVVERLFGILVYEFSCSFVVWFQKYDQPQKYPSVKLKMNAK